MLAAYISSLWEDLLIGHFLCESDLNALYELYR